MTEQKKNPLAGMVVPAGYDLSTARIIPPAAPVEAKKSGGAIEALADVGLSAGRGLVSGVKMVADAAGADNAISQNLGTIAKGIGDMRSDSAKQLDQVAAARSKEAEASGSTWEEVKAGGKNFFDRPFTNTIEGLASSVPALVGAAVSKGKSVPAMIGAVQGAGAVKGSIYEGVEQKQLEAGMTPAQAAQAASAAQAYTGPNAGQIVLGGGLGGVASATGIEGAITRLAGGQAAGGIVKQTALGVAKEAPMEAVQGGQERVAVNTSLQNEGFDVPTFQGAAGQATQEALAGGLGGGAIGAVEGAMVPKNTIAQDTPPISVPEGWVPPAGTVTPAPEPVGALEEAAMGAPVTAPGGVIRDKEAANLTAQRMNNESADGTKYEAVPSETGGFSVRPVEVKDGRPNGNAAAQGAGVDTGVLATAKGDPAAGNSAGLGDGRGAVPVEQGLAAVSEGQRGNPADLTGGTGPGNLPGDVSGSADPVLPSNRGGNFDLSQIRLESDFDIAAQSAAASEMNGRKEPTDAQKNATNYKMGEGVVQGLKIKVENPQGSLRKSRADDPNQWASRMTEHYGYFKGTKGADGDPVDTFVGRNVESPKAFVINQTKAEDGSFDEVKVMLGFDSIEEAKSAYYDNYQEGWQGGEDIAETSTEGLKTWLKKGDTTQPFPRPTPVDGQVGASGADALSAPAAAQSQTVSQLGQASRPAEEQRSPESGSALLAAADQSGQSVEPAAGGDLLSGAGAQTSGSLQSPVMGGNAQESIAEPSTLLGESSIKSTDSTSVLQKAPEVVEAENDGELPALPDTKTGAFTGMPQAAKFAKDKGLDASPVQTPDGFILAPNVREPSPEQQEQDNDSVGILNQALGQDASTQPAVPLRRAPSADAAVYKAVVKQLFNKDVVLIEPNSAFSGVAYKGKVYVADEQDKDSPLIATIGHEIAHTVENTELGDQLKDVFRQFAQKGAVEGRRREENSSALASIIANEKARILSETGVDATEEQLKAAANANYKGVSKDYAERETIADLNGGFWADPKFHGEMFKRDPNLARKVMHKFMELATKAIEIAKGSRFDTSKLVTDVEKVRAAYAQAWVAHKGTKAKKGPKLAPGDSIQMSRSQEDTPEFKNYFGKSKTVDKDGKPQKFYHGTARDIKEFRAKQAGATFVTPNPEFAGSFAEGSQSYMQQNYKEFVKPDQIKAALKEAKAALKADGYKGQQLMAAARDMEASPEKFDQFNAAIQKYMPTGQNIMPVYAKAEKPFDFEKQSDFLDLANYLDDQTDGSDMMELEGFDGKTKRVSTGDILAAVEDGSWEMIESKTVQAFIKKNKYDGFFVTEGGVKNLAVYDPTQVKSYTGNNGKFDPTDPRIQYSRKTDGRAETGRDKTEAGSVRVGGGVRGSTGVLDEPSGSDNRPLEGLPATVKVDGREVTFGPFLPAREAAARYKEKAGITSKPVTKYVKVDETRAKAIATEFDQMAHNPADPAVKASYDAMIKETLAQYEAMMETGLTVEFIDFDKTGDPYGNPRNAILDVVNNNHLWVFPTEGGFGGTESADIDIAGNPLLAPTEFKISGKTALANDIFRAVHDYFGHIKEGVGFRADGEENAWQQHASMYSDLARPAMTAETRGQNSWVNFGPYAEFNKTAGPGDTQYAPQKTGIMPEWTMTDGRIQFSRKAINVAKAESAFSLANSNNFNTNRELKVVMQERVLKAAKSPEELLDDKYLKNVALLDAKYALQTNANAVGWYDEKVSKALSVLATIHPETITDPDAKFAFTWALAVTSNGLKVDKNFELAEKAYRAFKATGKMPADIGIGTAKKDINEGLDVYNAMVETMGLEKLKEFMTTKKPVKEIRKITGESISGEAAATEVFGAVILGPKIGNGFFMNLYGEFGQLTMDRWLMRTWGRWTGTLLNDNSAAVAKKSEEIRAIVASMDDASRNAFSLISKGLDSDPVKLAQAIQKASQKKANRDRMNALPGGDTLRKMGNNLAVLVDGQKEIPDNGKERNKIRGVFAEVLKEMQKDTPDMTMADLQALLWYPEKRLYDSAKKNVEKQGEEGDEGYDDDAAPDYANAAVKLAQSLGVPQSTIDKAIAEAGNVTNGRTAAAQRGNDRDGAAPAYSRREPASGERGPSGGGLEGARRQPAVSVKPQRDTGTKPEIVGVHYGKAEGLTELSGDNYGTGIDGKERQRLKYSKDDRIKRRVYFYPDNGSDKLPTPETGLGPNVYTAKLSNLYDIQGDPLGIKQSIAGIVDRDDWGNAMESAIVDAGYDGYMIPSMIVVLDGDVPVTPLDKPQMSRKAPDWISQVPGLTTGIAEKVGLFTPQLTLKQRFDELKKDAGMKFVQGVADQFAPLKALDFKTYMKARLSKATDGALEGLLLFGKVSLDADGALVNDATGGFIDMMKQLKGEQDRFMAWRAGNRAADLKAQGRENLFTDTDISALKGANHGQMPDGSSRAMLYAQVNREMNAFMKSVLDIAEKAGTIDGASRSTWEKDFYVPFYRVLEEKDGFSGPLNSPGLTNQQAFKKLKGGKENLNDLMQNTILNWSHLLSSSMKNLAAAEALSKAEQIGAAHVVSEPEKGSLFVLENGKKKHYVIDDDFLHAAVSSIGFSGMKGWGVELASKAKRILSYGVTFSPSYRARNLMRDQLQAIATNPMSVNVAANLVKGFKYSSKNNPLYAQQLTGGGYIRMGASYEDNRGGYIKRLIGGEILDTKDKVVNFFRSAENKWQETGDRAESITRAAIYEKAIRDGKSHLEASYLARDSMDFSLQGAAPAIRLLAQTVPFFNARVQGMYKLGRAWNGDKKRFLAVTGAITMGTIALMLANRDDEDWNRREEWDRDTFWWFKVGDKAVRIPKPFEVGALATIAERGLEMVLDGMDAKARERFLKRLGHVVGDNLSMNPVPQIVKPIIDIYSNKNGFTGRPIESMGMERLSKERRIGPQTTGVAQALGNDFLSPVQIDAAIQGYFGWLGAHAAQLADFAVRPAMGLADKAERRVDDMFVVGDWVKQLPANQSRFVTEFYEQAKEVREAVADLGDMKKNGDIEGMKAFIEANRETLGQADKVNKVAKNVSKINSRLRQIDTSEKMLPEAKRAEIDRLNAIKIGVLERVAK